MLSSSGTFSKNLRHHRAPSVVQTHAELRGAGMWLMPTVADSPKRTGWIKACGGIMSMIHPHKGLYELEYIAVTVSKGFGV